MSPMGRPVKWRRVNELPPVRRFSPQWGVGQDMPKENYLLVEEYEAIRLKDYLGLEQEECAEHMQVSRPTFQRILGSARMKVADSLIHGKGILITGGHYGCKPCAQCRRPYGHGRRFQGGEYAQDNTAD